MVIIKMVDCIGEEAQAGDIAFYAMRDGDVAQMRYGRVIQAGDKLSIQLPNNGSVPHSSWKTGKVTTWSKTDQLLVLGFDEVPPRIWMEFES